MEETSFETRAIAESREWEHGDVTSPIHLSSTYGLPGIDPGASLEEIDPDAGEFLYARLSNPTRHAVEKQLADLAGGETAFTFASGTAAIAEAVGFHQQVALGNPLAPFDCYLLSRGLKILPVRMRQHEANAMALAEFLDDHGDVRMVSYRSDFQ